MTHITAADITIYHHLLLSGFAPPLTPDQSPSEGRHGFGPWEVCRGPACIEPPYGLGVAGMAERSSSMRERKGRAHWHLSERFREGIQRWSRIVDFKDDEDEEDEEKEPEDEEDNSEGKGEDGNVLQIDPRLLSETGLGELARGLIPSEEVKGRYEEEPDCEGSLHSQGPSSSAEGPSSSGATSSSEDTTTTEITPRRAPLQHHTAKHAQRQTDMDRTKSGSDREARKRGSTVKRPNSTRTTKRQRVSEADVYAFHQHHPNHAAAVDETYPLSSTSTPPAPAAASNSGHFPANRRSRPRTSVICPSPQPDPAFTASTPLPLQPQQVPKPAISYHHSHPPTDNSQLPHSSWVLAKETEDEGDEEVDQLLPTSSVRSPTPSPFPPLRPPCDDGVGKVKSRPEAGEKQKRKKDKRRREMARQKSGVPAIVHNWGEERNPTMTPETRALPISTGGVDSSVGAAAASGKKAKTRPRWVVSTPVVE